jgi:hypothetical protein
MERDGQVEIRQVLNKVSTQHAGRRSPARRPGTPGRVAGTPLLIVLAMAQFMVVLDGM